MPISCLVWSCPSNGNMEGISFHRLGKVRYSSWLKAIGRNPEENISPSNVICSKHFPESDFVVKIKRAVLKNDAFTKLLLPKNAPFTSQSKMSSPGPISRDPVPTDASLQRIDGNLSSSDSGSHPKPLITSSSDSAGLKGVQKRNRKLVRTFHTYASSPDMFKTRYMNERTKYHQLRYKHQLEKEKNRRLRNKVSHLKEVVNDIRRKDLLSPNACDLLEKTFSGLPLAIMKRMLANSRRGKTVRQKYDEVIRSFAMTLHFYSSKAYEYVRKTFNLGTSFTASD
ncbi:hypothetical protein JTB14_010470 [Gonioctena quinquepunctata]|nr:hypothetical protein JTB14_010470 [Gonioctena quinquepunctata]